MESKRIWPEVTIAGATYMGAVLFIIMSVLDIRDETKLRQFKDFVPYLSAIFLFSSYVVGLLVHNWIALLAETTIWPKKMRTWLRHDAPPFPRDRSKEFARLHLYGTPALAEHINSHYSLLILYRLLCPGIFFLAVAISWWLCSFFPLPIGAVVALAIALVYRKQHDVYRVSIEAAFDELSKLGPKRKRSRRSTGTA